MSSPYDSPVPEAAMQDPDKSVHESPQCLVVGLAAAPM